MCSGFDNIVFVQKKRIERKRFFIVVLQDYPAKYFGQFIVGVAVLHDDDLATMSQFGSEIIVRYIRFASI